MQVQSPYVHFTLHERFRRSNIADVHFRPNFCIADLASKDLISLWWRCSGPFTAQQSINSYGLRSGHKLLSSTGVIVCDSETACFETVHACFLDILIIFYRRQARRRRGCCFYNSRYPAEGDGRQYHGVTFLSQQLVKKIIGLIYICMGLDLRCLFANRC